jgi:tetratricopeptide (TPR) repeat protein
MKSGKKPLRSGRLFFLGLFLLICMAADGLAQLTIEADQQFDYARSRLDAGAFDEAIVEFNRFIHFFPEDAKVPQAQFQTGMAYFRSGRYLQAAGRFEGGIENFRGLPLQNESYFMLSRSHAGQGMREQAMLDLHNLLAIATDPDVIDRAHYELGWLHVRQGHWEKADQTFSKISPANKDSFRIEELQKDLARSDTIAAKNPTTAGLLSIVPGGGQLYCGRFQDALTAFLINTGLIWAALEAFDNDLAALGSVITFVGAGFYAGNIYGAVSSAHKYNRDQINAFQKDIGRHRQMTLSLAPVPEGAALCLGFSF